MVYCIATNCVSLDHDNNCRHPSHQRRLFPLGWLLGPRPACVFATALYGPDGRENVVCHDQQPAQPPGPPPSFRSSARRPG